MRPAIAVIAANAIQPKGDGKQRHEEAFKHGNTATTLYISWIAYPSKTKVPRLTTARADQVDKFVELEMGGEHCRIWRADPERASTWEHEAETLFAGCSPCWFLPSRSGPAVQPGFTDRFIAGFQLQPQFDKLCILRVQFETDTGSRRRCFGLACMTVLLILPADVLATTLAPSSGANGLSKSSMNRRRCLSKLSPMRNGFPCQLFITRSVSPAQPVGEGK